MNFEQWQATRVYREDISRVSQEDRARPGYLYDDESRWIAITEKDGETRYLTMLLGGYDVASDNLEEVERALYESLVGSDFPRPSDDDGPQRARMADALSSVGFTFSEHSTQAGWFLQIPLWGSASIEVWFSNHVTGNREYIVLISDSPSDDARWVASFALDAAHHAAALCAAISQGGA